MDADLKLKLWRDLFAYRELEYDFGTPVIIPEVRSALCNQNFPRYRAERFRLHK